MWKDIIDWENLYEVNEYGDVRNKKTNKLIKGDTNNAGYQRVCLYNGNKKKRMFRHRLVAIHFLTNDKNLEQVNHIDGNKKNNHVSNLEWCSQKENELHKIKLLKSENYKPFEVEYDNGYKEVFELKSDLAEKLGLSKTTIKHWLQNKYVTMNKYGIKSIQYI